MDVEIGQLVADRFVVEAYLGTGGMGSVYRVRDGLTERLYALKILHEKWSLDSRIRARFEREIHAASRIRHPGIIRMHGRGELPAGELYTWMEYLAGESLSELLARGARVPFMAAVSILVQAGRALAAAHRAGVVHRDVKPANLFLTPAADPRSPRVTVLDFGIARIVHAAPTAGLPGHLGTPGYMAPEQADGVMFGDPAVRSDPALDIYGLAVVGYELFLGMRPRSWPLRPRPGTMGLGYGFEYFRRERPEAIRNGRARPRLLPRPAVPFEVDALYDTIVDGGPEIYLRCLEADDAALGPVPPTLLWPEAAWLADLEPVLLRALSRDPRDRHESMNAMVADLERVVYPGSVPIGALAAQKWSRPDEYDSTQDGPSPERNRRESAPVGVTNHTALGMLRAAERLADEASVEPRASDGDGKRLAAAWEGTQVLERILLTRLSAARSDADRLARWLSWLPPKKVQSEGQGSLAALGSFLRSGDLPSLAAMARWVGVGGRSIRPEFAIELQVTLGVPAGLENPVLAAGVLRNVLAHRTEYELDPKLSLGDAAPWIQRFGDGARPRLRVPPPTLTWLAWLCRCVLNRRDGAGTA